jgi:hypothetical protein
MYGRDKTLELIKETIKIYKNGKEVGKHERRGNV